MVRDRRNWKLGAGVNFYQEVIRNSPWFRKDGEICKDLAMLEPGTRAAVQALTNKAKERGIDVRVLETYRSQARQSRLFMQKATQLRTVGTHGYGVAADLGIFSGGKYQGDIKYYLFLRDLARQFKLVSGIDWGTGRTSSFIDGGHVQRVPVTRQPELFMGSWYPPVNYDPYSR